MADNDTVDQDAIAAQWEASLDSEDPVQAAEAAKANEISGTMALQWAAMVEDGGREFGGGKNGGGERVLSQEEIDNLLGFSATDVSLDDHSGICAMIDVLLGGRRGQTSLRIEGRPYTTIETNLVKRLVEVVLSDAEQAFRPLSPVTFTIDRLETNPRFAAISRPANAAILVRLRIDMEDRGGNIELLLPYP